MKVRRITWLMRTIGALGLTAAVAAGADARSTMAYNAFRPWPNYGAQDCVKEDYGGAQVSSTCNGVSLVFETVVDTAGLHWIQAVELGTGSPFDCYAESYPQVMSNDAGGFPEYRSEKQAFNGTWGQILTFTTYVPPGWTLRFVCIGVPNGQGIISLNWNP